MRKVKVYIKDDVYDEYTDVYFFINDNDTLVIRNKETNNVAVYKNYLRVVPETI